MEEGYSSQLSIDINARVRDIEEKQRLLKDRVLLIGKSFVEDKDEISTAVSEMKKTLLLMQKENERLKEIIKNITQQLSNSVRREELDIVKRQLDLLRK